MLWKKYFIVPLNLLNYLFVQYNQEFGNKAVNIFCEDFGEEYTYSGCLLGLKLPLDCQYADKEGETINLGSQF